MSKIYPRAQIAEIIGAPVLGLHMHRYGLKFIDAGGIFCDDLYPGSVDSMLAAADCYSPNIHPVSTLVDGRILNRFESGAFFYMLYTGNCDPHIEFSNRFLFDELLEHLHNCIRLRHQLSTSDKTAEWVNLLKWRKES